MAVPSAPPPIAEFGARRFAFYPAIRNIPHNEWIYVSASWSEALVRNAKTSDEVWVPRRYLGAFSESGEPILIVGLLRELEYAAGVVRPARRHVIEIPRAVNDSPRVPWAEVRTQAAAVVAIRLEERPSSRITKTIVAGVALGLAGCVLAINLYRGGMSAARVFYAPGAPLGLTLTASDDYSDIVRSLGAPARERPIVNDASYTGILAYPRRGIYVVLTGPSRADARYAGALDWNGRPIHTVVLPGGGSSLHLLRSLQK